MIPAFFGILGCVATVPLENRRTVNALWYIAIYFPEIIAELRKKVQNVLSIRTIDRIIDNLICASSFTILLTMDYLMHGKLDLMNL